MSMMSRIEEEEAKEVVRSLGVISPYILYPANMHSHKNVGQIVAALRVLHKQGYDLRLILTGPGTERIRGHACEIGVELGCVGIDVLGLGYVSNLQMDSLIQCAAVVVSSSLYEAGNGPGLDAWRRGVPVAMSNIPAFVEHLQVQGVKAEVFDPHDYMDIALKISSILKDPERAGRDAGLSKGALENMSWEQTASRYLEIFDESLGR
jgi:glycosyltransferase involved in cell wall biosynthesis